MRIKNTAAFCLVGMLAAAPGAFAQQSTTPAGADNGAAAQKDANRMKPGDMKSGEMKPGGMKPSGSGAGPSAQGSSTPAGPAGDSEKKM